MKLPKTTLILIFIALTLGGIVYSLERKNTLKTETKQPNKQKIFNFKEAEINTLKIEVNGEILILEKTTNPLHPWQMKKPEEQPASDAVVSYLLNLLVNGQSDRTFTITPEQQNLYGLKKPFATITITLKDKKTHQLKLGKTSFNDEFIYGIINEKVVLLPMEFRYAVDRKLQEWRQE
jgi:Domain of unknown function (DUF4340)